MHQTAGDSYIGKIPIELYIELRNKFPQFKGETDMAWLHRAKRDPLLAKKMFGTPQFKEELLQAVARRTMAVAGGRRLGQATVGPALVPLSKPGAKNAKDEIAAEYRKDYDAFKIVKGKNGSERQESYAQQAYELLMEQFDGATPVNGSVFWNGINELNLAEMVHEWNQDLRGGGQLFGQLEATTVARYVNHQFEWQGPFKDYFTDVSAELGEVARGHVTAVVRCGLRDTSIFTHTELIRMLGNMDAALRGKREPKVTDISIVVIEPKHLPGEQIAVYTNNDIQKVPIIHNDRFPVKGPNDVSIVGYRPPLSRWLQYYWEARGKQPESPATARIRKDIQRLITWG